MTGNGKVEGPQEGVVSPPTSAGGCEGGEDGPLYFTKRTPSYFGMSIVLARSP